MTPIHSPTLTAERFALDPTYNHCKPRILCPKLEPQLVPEVKVAVHIYFWNHMLPYAF